MRTIQLLVLLVICTCKTALSQTDIIINGTFQTANYAWQTSGNFQYDSRFPNYNFESGYAYLADFSGNPQNDINGNLYQLVTIPANTTDATFSFYYKITTDETTANFEADHCFIQIWSADGNTKLWEAQELSNLDHNTVYQQKSYTLPATLYGVQVMIKFVAINNYSLPTVFRIDDVSLKVSSNSTSCVNWQNNNLPSEQNVIDAAEYLCQHQILLNNKIDVSELPFFTLNDAALLTLNSLYNGSIPESLPSDYYPVMFTDIDGLPFSNLQAIKAMAFLEYGDGISSISREFYLTNCRKIISIGDILRMLLEAYNIKPNNTGSNSYDLSSSTFLCNVKNSDYNYGYFQKAKELGLLTDYISGNCLKDNISPGEFFLVILQKLYSQYYHGIDNSAYYVPNNINLNASFAGEDISKAVFQLYEQNGFAIPTCGLGLNFNYSYHSNLTDLPLLPNEDLAGSFPMEKSKGRLYPLGVGWTHSYNIYIQCIPDLHGNDEYLLVNWGNGEIEIFNLKSNLFETIGVKDKMSIGSKLDGQIQEVGVTSKNQLIYQFKRDGQLLLLQSITNRNNFYLSFSYEPAIDAQVGVAMSNSRLSEIRDNCGSAFLKFSYQPETDLLNSVSDNTGRTIYFNVDKQNLDLASVKNARGYTTYYHYDVSSKNLLTSIQKPKGNTITNTYEQRKLKQTTTPDYAASVTFSPSYSANSSNTQTLVSVSPLAGNTYTTSFKYDQQGLLSQRKDNLTNIDITYGDPNNPNLPTLVTNSYSSLAEQYKYDGMGNVLAHRIIGQNNYVQDDTLTYDQYNDILTHKWPNGTTIAYSYDPNYNLIGENGPLGYTKTYTRDPLERISAVSDGLATLNIGYAGYLLPSSISFVGTTISQTATYDNANRINNVTNANGVTTHYEYDPNDNITEVVEDVDTLKITTGYTFDANDNLENIQDPNKNSTILSYNNSDDLIQETAGPLFRTWAYNDDGSLKQYQDKNGLQQNYSYYPSGHPNAGQLLTNGYQTFDYDEFSKVVQNIRSPQAPDERIHYNYDDVMRVKQIVHSSSQASTTVTYQYDVSNSITQIQFSDDGKHFTYKYDALNRITEVDDWNNTALVQYAYFTSGLLKSETLGNGVVVNYHYDAAERLDSIWSLKTDGTLLHAVGCSMDNNGNHIRESTYVNWNGTVYYPNYFSANSYGYDNNNHLTSLGSQTVTSDKNGNILANAYTGFANASYDLHNHLLACDVDGLHKVFAYDPLEHRYSNGNIAYTLDYLNNGNILVSQDKTSLYTQYFAHSPYGLVCSIEANTNKVTYYLYDFRGSTVALVDDNQNITQYYQYNAFGEITKSSELNKTTTPFLFVGKYGVMYEGPHLYYMRARFYDPTIGRFLSEDANWSTNLFNYASNNPLKLIDPDGKNWFSVMRPQIYKNQYGDPSTTLRNFQQHYANKTENDIVFGKKSFLWITYPNDMNREFRFVTLSNGSEVDMIHFMVVGRRGMLMGLGNEILQGLKNSHSAFDPQDFYSNQLGIKFFKSYNKLISKNPTKIADYIYEFLSNADNIQ